MHSDFTYFLWRLAGGDVAILSDSKERSQQTYWLIGLLYMIINCFVYVSFFGLFHAVFDNFLLEIPATLVMGFLVTNIYRLTLISLEPQTLPVPEEKGSLFLPYLLRYSTIGIFAFFVSKFFEMIVIGFLEDLSLVRNVDSIGYMNHMTYTLKSQPWLWTITVFMIVLFLSPILIRHKFASMESYYNLKTRRDIRLVMEYFSTYSEQKREALKGHYSEYQKLKLDKVYREHPVVFKDPPFNTKRAPKPQEVFSTGDDFIHDMDLN